MARLKEVYDKEIIPELMSKFGYSNKMQVPKIDKIVVNVGMGEMAHQKDLIEPIRNELAAITGQRPKLTRSKKAISNFKIREGVPVGYKVTLRKAKMYEFLDRLINFVIPRIKDFRGVSRNAFDQGGNYTLGIKEQTIFPELELDKVSVSHGMDVCIVTTASTKDESMGLLEAFGMPFTKKQGE
jgi:large subunit ribosomal protein L5